MASRSFFAIDNNNLVVDSSSNASIVGNPVINNSSTPDGTVFTYTAGGGTTVTVDDTGGSVDTFEDDNTAGHEIIDGGGIVADNTPVEAESLIFVRELDGTGTPIGPVITITVFSQNGVTGDVWGFATDIPLQDGVSYTKTGGSNAGSSDYADFVTCFGPGTLIRTQDGVRPIDMLNTGDMVWTRDAGPQPIRWIGHAVVPAHGAFAPVVFAPGALANDAELVVSQEHRMLLGGPNAELHFGEPNVLVAAKHLCDLPGVSLREGGTIAYTHLMFDHHQIISANGILSESFFLSPHSLAGVDAGQRAELLALFPSLQAGLSQFGGTAAMTLKSSEAAIFLRHLNVQGAARATPKLAIALRNVTSPANDVIVS